MDQWFISHENSEHEIWNLEEQGKTVFVTIVTFGNLKKNKELHKMKIKKSNQYLFSFQELYWKGFNDYFMLSSSAYLASCVQMEASRFRI